MIDGTVIHDRVADAVLQARERGCMVCISTGRADNMVPPAMRGPESVDYIICANGSRIYDTFEGVLYERLMTREQILEAIQYWKKQLENGNFLDESIVEGMNRIEKPMRRVHRSGAPLTVAELIEASRNLYDNQQNAPLNAGIDGEIYGQVNNVIDDNGKCILTLAPYKNGRRSKDLSVNGDRSPAISFDEIVKEVKSMPLHSEVVVKMKDPYGFGPKAAVPVEQEIEAFDIDSAYGLFLRLV